MKEEEFFENVKKKILKEVYVFFFRYEDIFFCCFIDKGIKVLIIKVNMNFFIVVRIFLMLLSIVVK